MVASSKGTPKSVHATKFEKLCLIQIIQFVSLTKRTEIVYKNNILCKRFEVEKVGSDHKHVGGSGRIGGELRMDQLTGFDQIPIDKFSTRPALAHFLPVVLYGNF
jgi:hypothetical protein